MKNPQYFILAIGVGTVQGDWNKHDVQSKIHTTASFRRDGFSKNWIAIILHKNTW